MIGFSASRQLSADLATGTLKAARPSYRCIRSKYQKSKPGLEEILVDHYAKLLSPLFTKLLIGTKITPNGVTVLMMIAGVVGAVLFAIPSIACKVLGLVFIHVWYVLDCSDGEVARITSTFSRFGTEIDYTAHIVNHPLFNLAFVFSLLGMQRYNPQILYLAAIFCISAELVIRNVIGFRHIYELKMGEGIRGNGNRGTLKKATIHVVNFFTMYPNFALVFPLVYLADRRFGTSIAMYYLLIHTSMSTLLAVRASYQWTRTIATIR